MGLYGILKETSSNHPENLAMICGGESHTYSELKVRVDALAHSMYINGIRKNDKIAVISKNCHRFLEIYFAAARLGAILVPINYRLTTDDFIYIINNSQAKVLIGQPHFISSLIGRNYEIPKISKIILMEHPDRGEDISDALHYETLIDEGKGNFIYEEETASSDIAQIYYTSGTTGRPKGVILTHGNNMEHAKGTILELNLSEKDRWLHVSPMFHLADSWAVWSITRAGGAHLMVPCFEQKNVLESIQRDRVTLSNFIPTMLNLLVNHPEVASYDFSSLRLIMSGGAPIAKEVVRKVIDVFQCNYIQTYGLTETSPFLTMSILDSEMKELPFEERLNIMMTTGRPFHNVQLKIIRENGKEVQQNNEDVGEILVKGETISPSYWELPKETKTRYEDGWLHTHDLAVVDQRGYITIVDRMDDMIITGGENVYSIEIEDVLYSHPDVLEAAVIGLTDPIWGEKVTAIVVLKPKKQVSELEIIEFCKRKLAKFKVPKQVFFTDSLPKTGSSKIYKFKLRELYKEK